MVALRLRLFPPERFANWLVEEVSWRAAQLRTPMAGTADGAAEWAEAFVRALLPSGPEGPRSTLFTVAAGEEPVGWVWLYHPDDEAPALLDARLPETVTEGFGACLDEWARRRGDRYLRVERFGVNLAVERLTRGDGWQVEGTNMALDLGEAGGGSALELRPMTEEVFEGYLLRQVEGYARALAASGTVTWEAALRESQRAHSTLLPRGVDSPDQHLFDAIVDGRRVGTLWLARSGARAGYVYDIVIDEELRGHGYGRRTMNAAADWCRDRGLAVLGLNVFGDNAAARALYESLGYRVVRQVTARPVTGLRGG